MQRGRWSGSAIAARVPLGSGSAPSYIETEAHVDETLERTPADCADDAMNALDNYLEDAWPEDQWSNEYTAAFWQSIAVIALERARIFDATLDGEPDILS